MSAAAQQAWQQEASEALKSSPVVPIPPAAARADQRCPQASVPGTAQPAAASEAELQLQHDVQCAQPTAVSLGQPEHAASQNGATFRAAEPAVQPGQIGPAASQNASFPTAASQPGLAETSSAAADASDQPHGQISLAPKPSTPVEPPDPHETASPGQQGYDAGKAAGAGSSQPEAAELAADAQRPGSQAQTCPICLNAITGKFWVSTFPRTSPELAEPERLVCAALCHLRPPQA